jgi:hypothetical protein
MLPEAIFLEGVRFHLATMPAPRPQLFRVLHDSELGPLWRKQLPQVHPMLPNQFSPFTQSWQLRSHAENPLVDASRWTAVYGDATWGTNGQGYNNPGDPRANYVTGADLTSPLPKVELLTCGGNVLTGRVEGDVLVVDVLDWRDTPPAVLMPWHITYPTRCGLTGEPVPLLQSKDTSGTPIPFRHPLIGDRVRYPRITVPMAKLELWTAAELPDVFKRYL